MDKYGVCTVTFQFPAHWFWESFASRHGQKSLQSLQRWWCEMFVRKDQNCLLYFHCWYVPQYYYFSEHSKLLSKSKTRTTFPESLMNESFQKALIQRNWNQRKKNKNVDRGSRRCLMNVLRFLPKQFFLTDQLQVFVCRKMRCSYYWWKKLEY